MTAPPPDDGERGPRAEAMARHLDGPQIEWVRPTGLLDAVSVSIEWVRPTGLLDAVSVSEVETPLPPDDDVARS